MANRFYTVLVIPEKTSKVRKIVLPAWILRSAFVGGFFAIVLGTIMLLDYWFVMNQIDENKELKIANRRLRQQVQIFKNKMSTIESTMDRIETFTTRLKVITNIEDRDGLVQSLNRDLPEAESNVGRAARTANLSPGDEGGSSGTTPATDGTSDIPAGAPETEHRIPTLELDPEAAFLQQTRAELDSRFTLINDQTLLAEQKLQDLYELLIDQKTFLAALPTRKPAIGYFTSGFGIRKNPLGERVKMHEGLDIANHPGTPVRATAFGVVKFAGLKPGYGRTVVIDHGYGLETLYGHNRAVLVKKGEKVLRGDRIAQMGSTGRSTGPHVHYEVHVHGIPVDPLSYILEN